MTEQAHSSMRKKDESRYATCRDFLKIFDEDMPDLYQLAFLLTGDHQKAQGCFVAGIDDCAEENWVFRDWARAWAKRVIIENAIRELRPRRSDSSSSAARSTVSSVSSQKSGPIGHFDLGAVLRLADFERFVFVLDVLERYREHECALFLGCSVSEVRKARTQTIGELAKFRQTGFDQHPRRESPGWAKALKA